MTALRGAPGRHPTPRARLLRRAAVPALTLALAGTAAAAPAQAATAVTAPVGAWSAGATSAGGTSASATSASATSADATQAPAAVIATAVKAQAASCVETPLAPGARGNPVTYLQLLLNFGGYWQGDINGYYGELTKQAVMAVQGSHGLHVDGDMGPATWWALCATSRPAPRTRYGLVLEVDKRRQVILVTRNGKTIWVLHTSTGGNYWYYNNSYNGGRTLARTPEGHFSVYQRINGWQQGALGTLYRPAYVVGGVAIHGGYAVPPHPASHGCIRQTNQAMDMLWASGYVNIGTSVWIYS
ncbi:MAG: L,D-transpeptidase family protein [Frankiaceae bacterium]